MIFFTTSSYAGPANRHSLPMGETEALLGNTGIAIRNSPANPIFNPAGIIKQKKKKVSVSGSTYGLINMSFQLESIGSSADFTSYAAVPNMVAGSRKVYNQQIIYGVFSPIELVLEADINSRLDIDNNGTTDGDLRVLMSRSEGEQYFGGATAWQLNKWDVGVSVFAHRFRVRQVNSSYYEPDIAGTVNLASIIESEREVISLLMILGVQKSIGKGKRIGFRLALPSLPVYNEANLVKYTLAAIPGVSSEIIDRKLTGQFRLPVDFGFGFSQKLSNQWVVYSDLSVQGPEKYKTIPGSGEHYYQKYKTQFRFSTGFKFQENRRKNYLFGFQFNPSALESSIKFDGERERGQNTLMTTGGILWKSGDVKTGTGLFYIDSRESYNFWSKKSNSENSMQIIGVTLSSSMDYL